MIAKLERDFVEANLAAIEQLLNTLKPSDFVLRANLESRRNELRDQLATMRADAPLDTAAVVGLFFGGDPVIANQGIETEFATGATNQFQEIVTTIFADRRLGEVHGTGPVAAKVESKLYITNVVRGSFGFQLEQVVGDGQKALFDTDLKQSVDQATRLMYSFGDPDDETYIDALAHTNQRVLTKIRIFFDYLQKRGATWRMVSGELDRQFDAKSMQLAIDRIRIASIREDNVQIYGQLRGLFPDKRIFEYKTATGTLHGDIDRALSEDEMRRYNHELLDVDSVATVRTTEVLRKQDVIRTTLTLLRIANLSPDEKLTTKQ